MKITIIGTGYVGLVTGVGLAELGHQVFCVDTDPDKIKTLGRGEETFYEPSLGQLLRKNLKSGRLQFTTNLAVVINQSQFIFICVGTPSLANGSADLSYLKSAAASIKRLAKGGKVVVIKSTVPVGTNKMIAKMLNQNSAKLFAVVSCPEFLREGKAVSDFFNPDRLVVGATKESVAFKVINLFTKVKTHKLITDWETAELIKYAANAFLATKISFINEIANICERTGANVSDVAKGMGLDKRINPYFLRAGIGYGGSCFPKDITSLMHIATCQGYNFRLLKSVIEVNENQRKIFVDKINKVLGGVRGKTIAVLGLAFKDNTDDVRKSAAIGLVKQLDRLGAVLNCYDPQAMANAKKELPAGVKYGRSAYDILTAASAVVIATEWSDFTTLDWLKVKRLMKQPIIFDGKNLLDPKSLASLKFKYYSVGRP